MGLFHFKDSNLILLFCLQISLRSDLFLLVYSKNCLVREVVVDALYIITTLHCLSGSKSIYSLIFSAYSKFTPNFLDTYYTLKNIILKKNYN